MAGQKPKTARRRLLNAVSVVATLGGVIATIGVVHIAGPVTAAIVTVTAFALGVLTVGTLVAIRQRSGRTMPSAPQLARYSAVAAAAFLTGLQAAWAPGLALAFFGALLTLALIALIPAAGSHAAT